MLGYCGINCHECAGYRGTVNSDMALLEKIGATYAHQGYTADDWVCLGCLPADQAFLARYCAGCGIRACAIGKGLQNCAVCPDYEGCTQLHEFIAKEGQEVVERMRLLRQRFLAGRPQP